MSVTLYDNIVPCDAKAVSLNPWRTRFVLNYKSVPYTTVWLPYAEISSTLKALGATATSVRADGEPRYTIPTIAHAGRVISNSFDIALYLEEQFPERPLFPPGTVALQRFFYNQMYDPSAGLITALPPFVQPGYKHLMDQPDAAYFETLWSGIFGTPVDAFMDTQEKTERAWKKLEHALDALDAAYAAEKASCFIGGGTPLYVDFVVAASFLMLSLVAAKDWEKICQLHDGRWKRLLQAVGPYMQVH
ncbi:hypothetical protein AURDEDRAFT_114236 [Auricularia subglabra TFB-10046 SS5]|nr:hypothetical protein AURDEDRAFT_114236 [Auricularia subglabra TFB-10046 SS5]